MPENPIQDPAIANYLKNRVQGTLNIDNKEVGLKSPEFGESQFDPNAPIPTVLEGNLKDYRGEVQSRLDKLGNAIPRLVSKVGTEIAKTPAYIYALGEAGLTDKTLAESLDNTWLNNLDKFDQSVKEQFAIYKPKSVREGNLWDNLTSASFWTDEGVDGAGFLLSMMAPGAALKATGIAGKLAKLPGLSKVGTANIELGQATLLNTALESAAETKGIVDNLNQQFKELLDPNSPNYNPINPKTGLQWTPEEIKQSIGDAAVNTFTMNMGLLTVPNMIMNKNLLGRFTNTKGVLDEFKDAAGKFVTSNPVVKKSLIKEYAKGIGEAALSEGFLEEAGQTTIENYNKKVALNQTNKDLLAGLAEEYINTLTTTEGQKAILLGSVLGSLGGLYGTKRELKAEDKTRNTLSQLINDNFEGFSTSMDNIFKKDDKGIIINPETNSPELDIEEATKVITNLVKEQQSSNLMDLEAIKGNKDMYDYIFNQQLSRFALPYLQTEGGLDILEQYIDNLSNHLTQNKPSLDENQFKQNVKSQLKDLQKVHSSLSETIGNLPLEQLSNDPKQVGEFANKLFNTAFLESSKQLFLTKQIQELNKDIISLEANASQIPQFTIEREKLINRINSLNQSLEASKENYNSIFDLKQQKIAFNDFITQQEDIQESIIPEESLTEEPQEIPPITTPQVNQYHPNNEINEKIKNAKSKSDLDNIANEYIDSENQDQLFDALTIKHLENWKSTIDKAVNSKELDSIIDQLDKEGSTDPELLDYISKKRESFKSQVPTSIQTSNTSVDNIETLSNGVTSALDNTTSEDLDKLEKTSLNQEGKKFTSKREGALMFKFYEFTRDGKKQWALTPDGDFVKSTVDKEFKEVSKTVDNPSVASEGTEVTYHHDNKSAIWLQEGETIIGYLGLPHDLVEGADDKTIAARETLIKQRDYILSQPSGSLKTTIGIKGNGKLLTKFKNNQPILDQKPSNRSEDLVDGKPLFLWDDGENLKSDNLSKTQQVVANQFKGKTLSRLSDPKDINSPRIGVGRVYQVVKTANDSWGVIPIYTELLGNSEAFEDIYNQVLTTLKNNISGNSIDYNKVASTLHKYVFVTSGNRYTKNHNALRIHSPKEDSENQYDSYITIARVKVYFKDITQGVNLDKFKEALGTIRGNISIDALNTTNYTNELLANNSLVTNANQSEEGQYYVQPYIEVTGITLEEPKVEAVTNTTFNNEVEHQKDITTQETFEDRNRLLDNTDYNNDAFSRTKLGDTEITSKDIEALNKILPGISLATAKQIQEVKGNLKDTYGMFHNMLIYLFNGATKGTLFHEAFHGVFRNILTDTERTLVLEDAKLKYSKPTKEDFDFLREGRGNELLNDKALTQLYYEEKLADDFAKYADGEINPSLTTRIKNFFKKIFDFFNIFKNKPTSVIQDLFENIKEGKLAKRSLGAKLLNKSIDLNSFGNAYSRVFTDKEMPLTAELDRVNSIANNLLSAISNEVANGKEIKDINIQDLAQSILKGYQDVLKAEYAKPSDKMNINIAKVAKAIVGDLIEVVDSEGNKSIKFSGGKFAELLNSAKKQISLTKKINIKGDFIEVQEVEGVENVDKQDENTLELTSDKGKGLQEMTAISGVKTATHEVKLFLSNIPVTVNGEVQKDAYGFTEFHPFEKIYYKLEQSLVGTTTFNEQLETMKELSVYSPEIKQVVEAIDNIKDPQKLKNFKQQFSSNFSKQVLNYKLVTYTKTGLGNNTKFTFRMFNPNRKDVAIDLKNKWLITNISDPGNKEVDDIRTFDVSKGVYVVDKTKVKELIDSYRMLSGNKIVLKDTFLPTVDSVYTLAHKLGISFSYNTLEEYNKIDPDNLRQLTLNLLSWADNHYVEFKGSISNPLFKKFQQIEMDVQTELFTSSFNNVENSVVYAIQNQSFASKLVNQLTSTSIEKDALIKDLQRDPMNYKNFVLKDTKDLEMFALDGLKMQGDNIEGKKFNQIHEDDYLAMIINMFENTLENQNQTKAARAIYAPIIPAEKGLSFAYAGNKIQVALENGKIAPNSEIQKEFEQLFYNELARIRQTIIDKKNLPIELQVNNYHVGKELGLKFNTLEVSDKLYKSVKESVEKTIDDTLKKGVAPSDFVRSVTSDLQGDISTEINNYLNKVYQDHLKLVEQKGIISKSDKGYTSNKLETTTTNTVENIIANWSLNSYLFNTSISNLMNGDPAFYKGAEDNGKRFYQAYSMLKFADTSVLDESYKYIRGGKMRINVIEDVDVASRSLNDLKEISENINNPEIAKIAEESYSVNSKGKGSINAADAQVFVSTKLHQELKRWFGNDSLEMREAYTNADIAERLNQVDPNGKGILDIMKPFMFGVQWDSTLNRYTPIQVKCSIFPISNKFLVNNPLLAKHKALMDADDSYPQAIVFESSMKALAPFKAKITEPENPSILELDLNNFGEQVANPEHQEDSDNNSLRQLKMLFYGMVENDLDYGDKKGSELKAEIARLDKANIEEALQEVLKAFKGDVKEMNKFIQEAITRRNSTSIMEDVFTMDENGKFQYPLDLINSKTTIQLISAIFSDRVIRQEFRGGSAPQASAIGLQIAPKEADYKNAGEFQKAVNESKELSLVQSSLKWVRKDPKDPKSIDYIEAYAPAHVKEFINKDGSIKKDIPEELKQLLVYRIPTEGAHSMMAVKVVGFLPAEYKGAMLLPLEVTQQFGADFDFDKIFFIARDFKINKGKFEVYNYISDPSKTEERYEIYKSYVENPISLEDFSKLSIEEQNIKPARNNRLLDNYIQILRSVNMLESLITPSGPGAIADVYKMVKEPISVGNFFTSAYQLFNKALFHKISMLKGVSALQVTGHAWATEGNLRIAPEKTKDGFKERGIRIYTNGKTELNNNLSQIISKDGKKIVEELSSMMAVILDAVKTPDQLPSIGISLKTLPMWSYLVRLGLGSKTASQFTSQQAIKDLSLALEANDIQLKDKSFTKKSIKDIKDSYNKQYSELWEDLVNQVGEGSETYNKLLSKVEPNKVSNFSILDLDLLAKFTVNKKNLSELTKSPYEKLKYLQLQLTVLNIFEENEDVVRELGQLNTLFSINKETGPNFEDVNGKLSLKTQLVTNPNSSITGIPELLGSDAIQPYLNTLESQMDVMKEHFNFAAPFFNAVKDKIADIQTTNSFAMLNMLKPEDRDVINGFTQMYLDAENTFKELYTNESKVSREDFLVDLKKLLSKRVDTSYEFKSLGGQTIPADIQEKLKEMTIFNSLEVHVIKNSNQSYASLKSGRYELRQKEAIINDLVKLYNSRFKQLAVEIVKHSFENTGFYTGTNAYFSYIHPSILQDMGLVEDRNKIKNNLEASNYSIKQIDNLIDQLIRNNAKKFTKVYDSNDNIFTEIDNGKSLVLDLKSQSPRLKEVYKASKESPLLDKNVKYIRYKLNEAFTPIYKLDEEATDSVQGHFVYRQITYLGSPGKLIEINPFEEVETKLVNNKYEVFSPEGKVKTKSVESTPIEPEIIEEPEVDTQENLTPNQGETPKEVSNVFGVIGEPEDLDITEESINLEDDSNDLGLDDTGFNQDDFKCK